MKPAYKKSKMSLTDSFSQENDLIRKQREEIILLTKELETQEEQINMFQTNILKLRNKLKQYEKQKEDLESSIKVLNKDTNKIKGMFYDSISLKFTFLAYL